MDTQRPRLLRRILWAVRPLHLALTSDKAARSFRLLLLIDMMYPGTLIYSLILVRRSGAVAGEEELWSGVGVGPRTVSQPPVPL